MNFDYIILGGGAAGLSLAYLMAEDPFFDSKNIAIIERNEKKKNDRTWCFWEIKEGTFENIVKKKWNHLTFYSSSLEKELDIYPYQYKMISGDDFYKHTIEKISRSKNISFINDSVVSLEEDSHGIKVHTKLNSYFSKQVFKSYPSVNKIDPTKHIYVDQHFKGFFIKTTNEEFDSTVATFMDFRICQNGETRFLYVLPTSPKEALVEVAVFSNTVLPQESYNSILENYIKDYLKIDEYQIEEEEFGIIPMTTYSFADSNTEYLFHIGTGGGIVKPSSGFAFKRIQEHSKNIIDCLKKDIPLSKSYEGLFGRHRLYDKIMLHALLKNGVSGEELFTRLFRHKKAHKVFKFLNQKSSVLEDFDIFRAPPTFPFLKSFFQLLFQKRSPK